MWAYESVFYQIYPLGFCGAPFENDGILTHRILKVNDWIEHIKNLGANAIYFSPVFESDTHGYNTRDYKKIDCRLGTNDDFKEVCENLHKNNIKVYGAPILPFGTSSFYSENSEKVRQLINQWMRSSESGVDGIIDFENAVADPANPQNLLAKYTNKDDGIHPYNGYQVMANAIDLNLFQ